MAIVNDGSKSRSYVDGVLRNTQSGGGMGAVSNDLYIGRRVQGLFAFKGTMDELRWWTAARTEEQICGDGGGTWMGGTCTLP